jgi:DNA-binding MarR family transcriptional regulator
MKQGLGTQLAHLLELLDGAVLDAYMQAGLANRPRFTPVMRALSEREPCTIGQIAVDAGISQPAATQTIALMLGAGLISSTVAAGDGRQRLVRLTDKGRELLPQLQACWRATRQAADSLDAELPFPLSAALDSAIRALERKSFGQRIKEARATLDREALFESS